MRLEARRDLARRDLRAREIVRSAGPRLHVEEAQAGLAILERGLHRVRAGDARDVEVAAGAGAAVTVS